MRKVFFYPVITALLLSVAGCATLPKKFIRPKKQAEHTASVVYLEQGPYQKKYSNEYYYKMHYTLWKTWQGEILDNLTGNSKKLTRSAEEALSHLEQLGSYLRPEKQTQLKPMTDELKKFVEKFQNSAYSRTEAGSMKSDLERIQRLVANDFYYDKVKSELVPDSVDLGSG